MHVSAWLVLALNGLAISKPLGTHVVHEKRDALPIAWTKRSRAPRDAVLPVRIGLKQRNLEHGDRFLYDISDPDSPNFGMCCACSTALQREVGLTIEARKTLDRSASRQHVCTTPKDVRCYSRMASFIRN